MFSKDNIFAEYKKHLEEKAASKAQQKLMGMAHAYNKGEMPDASDEVKKLAKDMKKSDVKDYASTKHKGLPDKVASEEDETEIDDEEQDSEEESEEEQPSGPSPEEIELEREKIELEKEKMEQQKMKENLRKKIAQLSAKYPEGSTWFCKKVNKKVKVLSVGQDFIKVGNGRKTLDCKPEDLSAVKEDVSLEEKGKGLWANIHAKRKRGEKPAKPGDPDYPETLDIEDVEEDNPCWDGYKKVPGKKDFEPGSCEKEEVEEAGYMDQPETKAEVDKKNYGKPEGDSRDKQVLKIKEAIKEMKIKKLDKDTLEMLKSLDDDEARLIIQGLPSSLRRKAMKELGLKEKVDGRTSAYKETAARLMAKKEVKEDVSPEDEDEFHKKLDDLVHDTFGKGKHEEDVAQVEESMLVSVRMYDSKDERNSEKALKPMLKSGDVSVDDVSDKGVMFRVKDYNTLSKMKAALRKVGMSVTELDESTKEYAKTLQTLADKAKKEKITPKDLATLDKLADMMKKANEDVEQVDEAAEYHVTQPGGSLRKPDSVHKSKKDALKAAYRLSGNKHRGAHGAQVYRIDKGIVSHGFDTEGRSQHLGLDYDKLTGKKPIDEADQYVVMDRKTRKAVTKPMKMQQALDAYDGRGGNAKGLAVVKTTDKRLKEEETELDEALQSVTKIKFDYKDTMPKDPKPSDVGGLKQDWDNDRMTVRDAIKPLGGLVTDSQAPSRANKFVGTLSIGTRGDASKLSNSAIQKAVKSKGAEIQNNQFMSESVELDEDLTEIIEWSNNFRFLTLTEKRAFIFAAAQAKADGKKTFEFHGKEYAVKIKGGPTVEASPVEEDEDEDKK